MERNQLLLVFLVPTISV